MDTIEDLELNAIIALASGEPEPLLKLFAEATGVALHQDVLAALKDAIDPAGASIWKLEFKRRSRGNKATAMSQARIDFALGAEIARAIEAHDGKAEAGYAYIMEKRDIGRSTTIAAYAIYRDVMDKLSKEEG